MKQWHRHLALQTPWFILGACFIISDWWGLTPGRFAFEVMALLACYLVGFFVGRWSAR